MSSTTALPTIVLRAAFLCLASAGLLVQAGHATAATIDCASGPVDRSGFVASSYDCSGVYGASMPESVEGLFDHSGWVGHGTISVPKKRFSGGSDGGLSILGNNISGTWSIDPTLLDDYESVMLVMFGGKKKRTDMMAYLVDGSEGEFSSPFLKGKKGNKQLKIRGFMLFLGAPREEEPTGLTLLGEDPGHDGREEYPGNDDYPTPVPLPAAGFLMLGGLGALGLMARRRRRAA